MNEIITLLNQASGFAKRENYIEAKARAAHALAVAEALASECEGDAKRRAERLVAKVRLEIDKYQAQHDEWNEAIRRGRQARTDNADEEMKRPLPVAPPSE